MLPRIPRRRDMKAKGLDMAPHRKRMVKEDLDTKFKDPDDPFRIVFVCAMWMTGFDVPSRSTIYLDKPMRNHTLMQTIARANRVFRDKVNGLIVDYVGVFRSLQKALAIYAPPTGGGESPIKDKSKLVELLKQAIAEVSKSCCKRQ
jgi:type I restriction enzyme, R subunit